MYDPVEYWSKRKVPEKNRLPKEAREYFIRHMKGSETVLDYGVGEGRLLHLCKGKQVTGFDIVSRYRRNCEDRAIMNGVKFTWTDKLEGNYDVILCSKVLLHVLPENIASLMAELLNHTDKVIVYDANCECTAHHNFNHNYSDIVNMKDVVLFGDEILFTYDGLC